jgi:hypothetical protein
MDFLRAIAPVDTEYAASVSCLFFDDRNYIDVFLLIKRYSLAAALGVTKFIALNDMISVTLYCSA